MDLFSNEQVVGERSVDRGSCVVNHSGGIRDENAGMSSERGARTPPTVSPRFPPQGQSSEGKPAPKTRPKGVVDGNQVNSPEPRTHRYTDGVTQ